MMVLARYLMVEYLDPQGFKGCRGSKYPFFKDCSNSDLGYVFWGQSP